jgi:ketosteroid isomerase-like protein
MTLKLDREALINRLYELEMAKDLDAWVELWADDAVIIFPHAVDPASRRVVGKDDLRRITAQKFADRETIQVRVETVPMRDPRLVLAKLDVQLTMAATRKVIAAPILCLFEFGDDDRIVAMQEYLNEAALTED